MDILEDFGRAFGGVLWTFLSSFCNFLVDLFADLQISGTFAVLTYTNGDNRFTPWGNRLIARFTKRAFLFCPDVSTHSGAALGESTSSYETRL